MVAAARNVGELRGNARQDFEQCFDEGPYRRHIAVVANFERHGGIGQPSTAAALPAGRMASLQ
jgi:hypothetical protein